ncbi:MAG: hypothetical protein FD152_4533, partial [Xanthobacteraceae bacterium]
MTQDRQVHEIGRSHGGGEPFHRHGTAQHERLGVTGRRIEQARLDAGAHLVRIVSRAAREPAPVIGRRLHCHQDMEQGVDDGHVGNGRLDDARAGIAEGREALVLRRQHGRVALLAIIGARHGDSDAFEAAGQAGFVVEAGRAGGDAVARVEAGDHRHHPGSVAGGAGQRTDAIEGRRKRHGPVQGDQAM